MTDILKKYAGVLAIVALVVGGAAFLKSPDVGKIESGFPYGDPAQLLGAVGNRLVENYDPYIKYNGGFRSALPFLIDNASSTFSGIVNLNGTTTIEHSPDGFVVTGSLGTSATSTGGGVQTVATNNYGNVLCDKNSANVTIFDRSVFNGAQSISVGTTTSSGAATNNLVASSTVATSTPDSLVITNHAATNDTTSGRLFVWQPQDIIQISLRDGDSAAADTSEPTASSTNYASRDIEFSMWCTGLGI